MQQLFSYNWQVREEWFEWCEELSCDDFFLLRNGGQRSFYRTFLHLLDVEKSWVLAIEGKPDEPITADDASTLAELKDLSARQQKELNRFFTGITKEAVTQIVSPAWTQHSYSVNVILQHLIAHEIHHIGQLSVWARELNRQPVSADLIDRKLPDHSRF